MKRVSTGFEALDELMGGGFPSGYNFVISGKVDTNKTVFTHIIANDFIKRGGKCLYIVTNRDPSMIKNEFEELGFDYSKVSKSIFFLDCFGWKTGNKESVATEDLTNVSIQLERIRNIAGKENVMEIFDTSSDFFINNKSRKVIRFLESACARVLKTGSIALFIMDTGAQKERDLASLESITQGTIELENNYGINSLRVSKLIGLKHDNSWIDYEIIKNKLKLKRHRITKI